MNEKKSNTTQNNNVKIENHNHFVTVPASVLSSILKQLDRLNNQLEEMNRQVEEKKSDRHKIDRL